MHYMPSNANVFWVSVYIQTNGSPSPPLTARLLVLLLCEIQCVRLTRSGGEGGGCLAHVFPLIGRNTPVRLCAQRKRQTQIQFERVALRFPLMRKFDDHMQLGLDHRLSAPAGSCTLHPPALDLPLNGAFLTVDGWLIGSQLNDSCGVWTAWTQRAVLVL